MAPVMLELWEMQGTASLQSVPGPLLPGVVASESSHHWVKKNVRYLNWVKTNDLY